MNALDFHKLLLESINIPQEIKVPELKISASLPLIPKLQSGIPVSDFKNDQSVFPWGFLLLTCATISLIIYLRNKAHNQVSEEFEQY